MNNRSAVPCEVDGILFPSKLEARTYVYIRDTYKFPFNIAASNPHKVLIKPATDRFPAINWKVDFYLPRHDVYIESKGQFERDWLLRMRMLDYFNPTVLDRLLVVSHPPSRVCWKGNKTIGFIQLINFLQGLK